MDIKLTQFAKGAGCGCKISPTELDAILEYARTQKTDPLILVGNAQNDDAAVYDLQNGNALIISADFFMPIVDDAFTFGKVAAANSLSDIYAMGGKPITAIAILGWPIDKLPAALAGKVLDGAKVICAEAGVVISGGHTIDSPEPFFGLSVNGMAPISHIKRNDTAQKNDVILITKPIGVGILATAQKRGLIHPDELTELVLHLTQLNQIGEFYGTQSAVHAMTDITGFGILGHLTEMAKGSQLTAHVTYTQIPKLASAIKLAANGVLPDATYRNWNAYEKSVTIDADVNAMESFTLLPDPQTNGGLLLAVDPDSVNDLITQSAEKGIVLTPIGTFSEMAEKAVHVHA